MSREMSAQKLFGAWKKFQKIFPKGMLHNGGLPW